jgi:hypothetical protein
MPPRGRYSAQTREGLKRWAAAPADGKLDLELVEAALEQICADPEVGVISDRHLASTAHPLYTGCPIISSRCFVF